MRHLPIIIVIIDIVIVIIIIIIVIIVVQGWTILPMAPEAAWWMLAFESIKSLSRTIRMPACSLLEGAGDASFFTFWRIPIPIQQADEFGTYSHSRCQLIKA